MAQKAWNNSGSFCYFSRHVFALLLRLIPEVISYQHWATYIIQILDLLVEADPSLAQDPQYISFRKKKYTMTINRTPDYYRSLVKELLVYPKETSWLEFKHNNADPQEIGEYISALANSAVLEGKSHSYLI